MTVYRPLPGSTKFLLKNSRPAGRADMAEVVALTVRVRSRGRLEELEAEAYRLGSLPVAERTYMTHAELEQRFGAAPADLDTLERAAQRHDLRITRRSAATRSITLEGRLGDLLSMFHADVRIYHHAAGTYRGRRDVIGVPAELKDIVTGVFGFDTRPHQRMPHRLDTAVLTGADGDTPLVATDFAQRYGFPTQDADGHALDGSGQTIGIIELGGGYRNADLAAFFREIDTSLPAISAVSVDRATHQPSDSNSDDGEVMLDLEVAGTVVPKAKFVVYFAPNRGVKGFFDAINHAVHDQEFKPGVISISWGGPESSELQALQAFHEVFVEAAVLGITVCAASGDHGTAVQEADHWDGLIHVGHPASDPMVLACGGTQVDHKTGQDVVWNDGTPFDVNVRGGGGWASVGGISAVYAVPPYQAGVPIPTSLVAGQRPGRGVPDIAMSAQRYYTLVDSAEHVARGTSAVAPLMAALAARCSQYKGKNVGFLNPILYANRNPAPGATAAADAPARLFKDVLVGTNAIRNTTQGYPAGPIWNACTGLGTPVGTAILAVL